MKELFQKLSANSHSFKENRLVYQREGGAERPKTDEKIFDEMVREAERAEEKRKKRKEELAEYEAHPDEWIEERERKKMDIKTAEKLILKARLTGVKALREKADAIVVMLQEKEWKIDDKTEKELAKLDEMQKAEVKKKRLEKKEEEVEAEEEAEEAEEAAKINDAIEYAKELMADVKWVGKINYKSPKFIDIDEFYFHHYINQFKPSRSSELSEKEKIEIADKIAKVGELISDVQREMLSKKLESRKWQRMAEKNPKVFQKQVKRYFNKLNKPLKRMPGKERKEFVLYTAAFLDKEADEHARDFVAEMLTHKRPRDVIAEYSKPIPAVVAVEE